MDLASTIKAYLNPEYLKKKYAQSEFEAKTLQEEHQDILAQAMDRVKELRARHENMSTQATISASGGIVTTTGVQNFMNGTKTFVVDSTKLNSSGQFDWNTVPATVPNGPVRSWDYGYIPGSGGPYRQEQNNELDQLKARVAELEKQLVIKAMEGEYDRTPKIEEERELPDGSRKFREE